MRPFSTYCGPAALASALGVSREDAAARLDSAAGKRHTSSTNILTIGKALGREVKLVWNKALTVHELGGGKIRVSGRVSRRAIRPTLSAWLRENPKAHAVLRASTHFLHVRNGKIVEANGLVQPRARVTHVIHLGVTQEA